MLSTGLEENLRSQTAKLVEVKQVGEDARLPFAFHSAQNRPDGKAIYFCGNSLGLLSKKARQHIMEELDVWSTRLVPHFRVMKLVSSRCAMN